MKSFLSILIGISGAIVLTFAIWLIVFGIEKFCNVANVLMKDALSKDEKRIQVAALESLQQMTELECAVVSVRLKMGDRTFIKVVDTK